MTEQEQGLGEYGAMSMIGDARHGQNIAMMSSRDNNAVSMFFFPRDNFSGSAGMDLASSTSSGNVTLPHTPLMVGWDDVQEQDNQNGDQDEEDEKVLGYALVKHGGRTQGKKRAACQTCFGTRMRCEFSGNAKKCDRCSRLGMDCVPRVLVKRRRKESGKNRQDGDAEDDVSGELSSSGSNEGKSGENGITSGGASAERAGSGWTNLDLNALRSVECLHNHSHIGMCLSSASAIVKLYKGLGFAAPPMSLRWMCASIFLVARYEKSLPQFHSATTMACAAGIDLDVSTLTDAHSVISEEKKEIFIARAKKRFLEEREKGACFFIIHVNGQRSIHVTEDYQFFFQTADEIKGIYHQCPYMESWLPFVIETDKARMFQASTMKALLKSGDPVGDPPAISWEPRSQDEKWVIQCNQGFRYLAQANIFCSMTELGYVAYYGFGFKDLEPLDEGAKRRMDEYQRNKEMFKKHGVTRPPAKNKISTNNTELEHKKPSRAEDALEKSTAQMKSQVVRSQGPPQPQPVSSPGLQQQPVQSNQTSATSKLPSHPQPQLQGSNSNPVASRQPQQQSHPQQGNPPPQQQEHPPQGPPYAMGHPQMMYQHPPQGAYPMYPGQPYQAGPMYGQPNFMPYVFTAPQYHMTHDGQPMMAYGYPQFQTVDYGQYSQQHFVPMQQQQQNMQPEPQPKPNQ